MAVFTANVAIDITALNPIDIILGAQLASTTVVTFQHTATSYDQLRGVYTMNSLGEITGGYVNQWTQVVNGATQFTLTGVNYPILELLAYAAADDPTLFAELFAGYDSITGSTGADRLNG